MYMDDKRPYCPMIDVDGVIAGGKQFDLDITLPEDNRDVIYGVIKNCFKEPVRNAVVKLTEIVYDCGKEERRPIGHTFTDEEGEFVFGPLCPDKKYALQIWANTTKKIKVCAKCHHEGKCLKGEKCDKCDCYIDDKKPWYEEDKEHYPKDDKWDYGKEEKKEHCPKDDKWDYGKEEEKEHCHKDDKWDHCKEEKKHCEKDEKCDCCKDDKKDKDDCKKEEKWDCYKKDNFCKR